MRMQWQWGDKIIGRSTYRVVKVREYAYAIQEIRDGRMAMTSPYYEYYDDAMDAVRCFDDEYMVMRRY